MNDDSHTFQKCAHSNEGMTPLSCAAEAGHHDIIEFLLGITSLSVEGTGKLEVR